MYIKNQIKLQKLVASYFIAKCNSNPKKKNSQNQALKQGINNHAWERGINAHHALSC